MLQKVRKKIHVEKFYKMSLNGISIPDVSCSDIYHNINVFKSSIILYIKNIKKKNTNFKMLS